MIIRKALKKDMPCVLELIQELAIFEKEPDAVVVTVDDLVRDGFSLYKEIIQQGKAENVRRIEWNVLDWNTPAIDFYEKSGAKVLGDWRVVQMDENGIKNFISLNT